MITAKLEDFENHRSRLHRYALALMRAKGSGGASYNEYEDCAKDIVQNCYLVFHSKCTSLDKVFENKDHLHSFLKICLYKKYQEFISPKNRLNQYVKFKVGGADILNLDYDFGYTTTPGEDCIDRFTDLLTEKQKTLVLKRIDGYKLHEIAKMEKVSRQAIDFRLDQIKKKYING